MRLLSGLATTNRGAAWQTFLRKYSSLILHIVRRHEADESRVMDIYLFVCDKLSESDFRRLRKFKSDGSATFSTWLTTVTRNLCVDWHRSVHGRNRPSAITSRLSDLENFVFRELYEEGTTKAECLNSLPEEFSHVTAHDLKAINARIHTLLTPARRWKLMNQGPAVVPLDDVSGIDTSRLDTGADDSPRAEAISAEQTAGLERAIAGLDVDERLAIRLRFQEDLSFDQIAQALGISSKYRVRALINGALSKLRRVLTD
jgi:RNA polymerase sigma factor (sigma-70 family)